MKECFEDREIIDNEKQAGQRNTIFSRTIKFFRQSINVCVYIYSVCTYTRCLSTINNNRTYCISYVSDTNTHRDMEVTATMHKENFLLARNNENHQMVITVINSTISNSKNNEENVLESGL